jgi:hypothetical protein
VSERRCEGRRPTLAGDASALTRRLQRASPLIGGRRSFCGAAAALAEAGYLNPATGTSYTGETIRLALAAKQEAA